MAFANGRGQTWFDAVLGPKPSCWGWWGERRRWRLCPWRIGWGRRRRRRRVRTTPQKTAACWCRRPTASSRSRGENDTNPPPFPAAPSASACPTSWLERRDRRLRRRRRFRTEAWRRRRSRGPCIRLRTHPTLDPSLPWGRRPGRVWASLEGPETKCRLVRQCRRRERPSVRRLVPFPFQLHPFEANDPWLYFSSLRSRNMYADFSCLFAEYSFVSRALFRFFTSKWFSTFHTMIFGGCACHIPTHRHLWSVITDVALLVRFKSSPMSTVSCAHPWTGDLFLSIHRPQSSLFSSANSGRALHNNSLPKLCASLRFWKKTH